MQKLAHYAVLVVTFLLSSLGLMAQNSAKIQVSPVSNQQGWYDVQFQDAASAYSLKALTADKAGKDAIINRLYINDVTKVARIELIDKGLQPSSLKAIIEQKALGSLNPTTRSVNQSTK